MNKPCSESCAACSYAPHPDLLQFHYMLHARVPGTPTFYEELPEPAVHPRGRFKHVMALALNPHDGYRDGVIRCITHREGDVAVSGFLDRSELHVVIGAGECRFEIGEKLTLAGEEEILAAITPEGYECIGFEDPDLAVDEEGTLHLYFTIPLLHPPTFSFRIYLGHASGPSLSALHMHMPVLMDPKRSAKEISLAPISSDGIYRHLIESNASGTEHTAYSTIRVAKQHDGTWEFGETIFHPAHGGIDWAGGHASPGPFLPRSFIDVGEGKLLGFLNGREPDRVEREQVVFGTFSVGLFIYDYEHGEISWVSPAPLIQDSEAATITFASQFVETGPGEGVLYAHVDDSFVRAYRLTADALRTLLPDD